MVGTCGTHTCMHTCLYTLVCTLVYQRHFHTRIVTIANVACLKARNIQSCCPATVGRMSNQKRKQTLEGQSTQQPRQGAILVMNTSCLISCQPASLKQQLCVVICVQASPTLANTCPHSVLHTSHNVKTCPDSCPTHPCCSTFRCNSGDHWATGWNAFYSFRIDP